MKFAALALITLGVLALIYGGFWYTTNETKAELGPVKIKVQERRRFNVPLWSGVVAIAAGTGMLLFERKRS